MKTTDLITIVMPVYERLDYFEYALDSALQQTVRAPILVVDNASSHQKFRELVDSKTAATGIAIRYVKNERNLGMFGNWNRCAELAETLHFIVLCDDDALDPDYVGEFLKAIGGEPALDFYYTAYHRFGSSFRGHPSQAIRFGLFDGTLALSDAANHGLCWPTNSTVYRTKMIRGNPWYNPSTQRHPNSDWLLVYGLAAGRRVFGNPKPLYSLRSHEANAGSENVTYIELSRSRIHFEIGAELESRGNFRDAIKAYQQSALHVVNAFLGNPSAFRKLVAVGLRENDGYLLFIAETWAVRSPLIHFLVFGKSAMARRIVWVLCRVGRFSSRFYPAFFHRMATGKLTLFF